MRRKLLREANSSRSQQTLACERGAQLLSLLFQRAYLRFVLRAEEQRVGGQRRCFLLLRTNLGLKAGTGGFKPFPLVFQALQLVEPSLRERRKGGKFAESALDLGERCTGRQSLLQKLQKGEPSLHFRKLLAPLLQISLRGVEHIAAFAPRTARHTQCTDQSSVRIIVSFIESRQAVHGRGALGESGAVELVRPLLQ